MKSVEIFMEDVIAKNPGEKEFHQAVQEVAESVMPYIEKNPKYKKAKILERIAEPERVIMFRVPWLDDNMKPRQWREIIFQRHNSLIYQI